MDAGGDHLGAEFLEDQGGDEIGRAVAAVDHHLEAVERHVVGGVFGELNVPATGVVDAVGLADLAGRQGRRLGFLAEDVALDQALELVVELVAVRSKNLHPVVLVGIVGGGDHDACGGTH